MRSDVEYWTLSCSSAILLTINCKRLRLQAASIESIKILLLIKASYRSTVHCPVQTRRFSYLSLSFYFFFTTHIRASKQNWSALLYHGHFLQREEMKRFKWVVLTDTKTRRCSSWLPCSATPRPRQVRCGVSSAKNLSQWLSYQTSIREAFLRLKH